METATKQANDEAHKIIKGEDETSSLGYWSSSSDNEEAVLTGSLFGQTSAPLLLCGVRKLNHVLMRWLVFIHR